MAWTTPRTYTTGELVTAAILNTHVRDNLLETAPAKVTTAGDIIVATGANGIKRLGIGGAASLLKVNTSGNDVEWFPKGTALYYLRVNSGGTNLEWGELVAQKPRRFYKGFIMANAGAGTQTLTITGKGRLLGFVLKNASSTGASPDIGVTIDGNVLPVSTVLLAANQFSAPPVGFLTGAPSSQLLEMTANPTAVPRNAETDFDTSVVFTVSQASGEDGPAMLYVAYCLEV